MIGLLRYPLDSNRTHSTSDPPTTTLITAMPNVSAVLHPPKPASHAAPRQRLHVTVTRAVRRESAEAPNPALKRFFLCGLLSATTVLGCFQARPDNPVQGDPSYLTHGSLEPTLVIPNGTEQWYSDSSQLIQWNPGIVPPDSMVSLRLSLEDGQTFPTEIALQIANTGSYLWTVTSLSSRACRVKITSAHTEQIGPPFEILVKPVAIQQTSSGGEWPSWRFDRLVYMSNRNGQYDIYASNGPGQLETQLTNNPADDRFPSLDNKGYHLAFSSVRTGREEIWASSYLYDFRTDELQLTFSGGSKPSWRPLPRSDRLAFLLPKNGLLNIGTVQFSLPMAHDSQVAPVKILADNTVKDRLSWIFGPGGTVETLYYQDGGFQRRHQCHSHAAR